MGAKVCTRQEKKRFNISKVFAILRYDSLKKALNMLTVSRYVIRVFHIYFKSTMWYGDMFENKCTINDLIVISIKGRSKPPKFKITKKAVVNHLQVRGELNVSTTLFSCKKKKKKKKKNKKKREKSGENTLKIGLI